MSLRVLQPWICLDKEDATYRRDACTKKPIAYGLLMRNWGHTVHPTYCIVAWESANGGPIFSKLNGKYKLKNAMKTIDRILRKEGFYLL